MNKAIFSPVFCFLTLVTLVIFWMLAPTFFTSDATGSKSSESIRQLIQYLITAIPILIVTLNISQATKLGNYITQSELCLKELECWAQEMFVCTYLSPDDYKIVTDQAAAGVKYAFIRHILTRHGQDSTASNTLFPSVIVRANGSDINDVVNWKKRFAKAVIKYKQWYKILKKLGNEGFPYEDSFAGLLNKELNIYGDNPSEKSIMEKLKVWEIKAEIK